MRKFSNSLILDIKPEPPSISPLPRASNSTSPTSHTFPLAQISEPMNKIRKVNSCQITTSTQGLWPVGILEFQTFSVAKIRLNE